MKTWPSDLPQKCETSGYQSGTGDGRIRSDTAAGVAKLRRRFSYVPKPFSGAMLMTTDQLTAFKMFINDDIGGGVLPFTFPAQDEGGTWTVQFGQNMPTWSATAPDRWAVSLDLVILP